LKGYENMIDNVGKIKIGKRQDLSLIEPGEQKTGVGLGRIALFLGRYEVAPL